MAFSNKIKTILEMDDKDWKKALKSISEAEKLHYKESSANTEKLIQAKKNLQKVEDINADKLIDINKKIANVEKSKTKAMKNGASTLASVYTKKLKLYKQERTELLANNKVIKGKADQEVLSAKRAIDATEKYNIVLQETKARHIELSKAYEKESATLKVTADQLLNRLVINKDLMNSTRQLTEEQKQLLFAEQKRLYAEKELQSSGKITLSQLKERIALQRQVSLVSPISAEQKLSAENQKYLQYKKELSDAEQEVNRHRLEGINAYNKEQSQIRETIALRDKERDALKSEYQNLYVNTKAQNSYNAAKARLDKMLSINAIDTNQYNKSLGLEAANLSKAEAATKKLADSKNKATRSTESLANATIRYLRWAGTIAGVVYAANRAWNATLGTGIEVNKIIETNTNGIAALVSANTQMIDSYGNLLTPIQRFGMAQVVAKKTIEDVRIASIKTAATFPQLLEIFQQGQGQALAMGDAFGTTLTDINTNLVKFSGRMSNFANAIGMPMDRVKEEMRSMLSGNASTDSLISTIIFGSPTEANEAIRKAKTKTEGMVKLLNEKFQDFDILADTKTYEKSILAIQDSWSRLMGDMVQKSGMFQDITDMFYSMSEEIKTNSDGIVEKFDSIYRAAKEIAESLDEIAVAAVSFYVGSKLISGISFLSAEMGKLDNKTKTAKTSIDRLSLSLKSLALTNAPLLLLTAGVTALGLAARGEEKYIDRLVKKYEDMYNVGERVNKTQEEDIKEVEKLSRTLLAVQSTLYGNNKLSETELAIAKEKERLLLKNLEILGKGIDVNNEGRKNAKETQALLKKEGELRVKHNFDAKLLEEATKKLNADKEKTLQLEEELSKTVEERLKYEKALASDKDIIKDKTILASYQEKIDVYNKNELRIKKEIAEENQKQNEKALQDNEKLSKQMQAANAKYAEQEAIREKIRLLENGAVENEEKTLSLLNIKLAGLKKEYDTLTNKEDKEKVYLSILETQVKATETLERTDERRLKTIEKIAEQSSKITKEYEKIAKSTVKNADANKDEIISIEEYAKARKKLNDDFLTSEQRISQAKIQAEADLAKTNIDALSIVFNKHAKDIALAVGNKNFKSTEGTTSESSDRADAILQKYADAMTLLTDVKNEAIDDLNKAFEENQFRLDFELEGFDEVTNSLSSIASSYKDIANGMQEVETQQAILNKQREAYGDNSKEALKEEKKLNKMQSKNASDQIGAYGDMAGALKSFTKEGTREYKTLGKIQEAMYMAEFAMNAAKMVQQVTSSGIIIASKTAEATAAGTAAVVNQGTGDPYSAFARMAAMAALVASLGIAVGGAISGGTSMSSDAFSAQAENIGKGSVLGDKEAVSESLANSMEILEDFAEPQYQTLQSMNKYLANISNNIGGITSLLVQQGGLSLGEGFNPNNSKKFDVMNNSFGKKAEEGFYQMTGIGLMDKIFSTDMKDASNGILGLFTGTTLTNKIVNSLFGSTKQSLVDYGISFNKTLLEVAVESIDGQSFQTIQTTKKSIFKKSSSISSVFEDLDAETERQFSLVLSGLYNSVLLAGDALDSSSEETAKSLENFIVNIGKISLKDKTGEEIQEQLTAVFGAIGDDIAKTSFPLLDSFQKVGEGMFETLSRVATGMEEAEHYIERLGVAFSDLSYTDILNPQGDIGFEALLQSIAKADEAIYGLDNNLVLILETLNSTTEELYGTYTALDRLRDSLVFIGKDSNGLSFEMIKGAGSVSELASGFDDFFENFLSDEKQAAYQAEQLNSEFAKFGITMPQTREGFVDLLEGIDLTTEGGQRLYGGLITLSSEMDKFSDNVEDISEAIADALSSSKANIKAFIDSFKSDDMLAGDLASGFGTTLSKTWDELANKLDVLSSDKDGLTDEELNLLNANKAYIIRLQTETSAEITKIQQNAYQDQINAANEFAKNLAKSISTIESAVNELENLLNTLWSASDITNTYGLNAFNESLNKTLALSVSGQANALAESVLEMIGLSSALTNQDNFNNIYDMQFAQKVAGNKLEGIDLELQTELDVLKQIEINTAETVNTLTEALSALGSDISTSIGQNTEASNTFARMLEELVGINKTVTEKWISNKDGTSSWVSTGGATATVDDENIGNNDTVTVDTSTGSYTGKDVKDYINSIIREAGSVDYSDINDLTARNAVSRIRKEALINGISANSLDSLMGWAQGNSNMLARTFGLSEFKTGGYTGQADTSKPMGIVHGNEWVVNSPQVNAIGGPQEVEKLIREASTRKDLQRAGATIATPKPSNNKKYDNSNTVLLQINKNMVELVQKVERTNQLSGASVSTLASIKESVAM